MPWSPIPKIPNILKNLNQRKYKNATTVIALENAIMEETGVCTQKTITNIIRVMARLGYVRSRPDGALDMCLDAKPYNWFEQEKVEGK